jgi:hypothetical protein
MLFNGLAIAQKATNYSIDVEFFPSDAEMYGVEVSPDHFMRGSAVIALSGELTEDTEFYLHGELKIDSVIMDGVRLEHKSEKVIYGYDYSNLAVKTSLAGITGGFSP